MWRRGTRGTNSQNSVAVRVGEQQTNHDDHTVNFRIGPCSAHLYMFMFKIPGMAGRVSSSLRDSVGGGIRVLE